LEDDQAHRRPGRVEASGRLTYSWADHTAELELRIDAESREEVFLEALRAFAEVVGEAQGDECSFEVELDAPDRAALLARWLEELVFLAETEGFVPRDAEIDLGENNLSGALHGRIGEPSPLVKAVTYHSLAFEEQNGRWRARAVLDV
jgi:SHS2 domain-containing protein